MKPLHLTRAQHDALLTFDAETLQQLFAAYNSQWSISGVTFHNVPDSLCPHFRGRVNDALEGIES